MSDYLDMQSVLVDELNSLFQEQEDLYAHGSPEDIADLHKHMSCYQVLINDWNDFPIRHGKLLQDVVDRRKRINNG